MGPYVTKRYEAEFYSVLPHICLKCISFSNICMRRYCSQGILHLHFCLNLLLSCRCRNTPGADRKNFLTFRKALQNFFQFRLIVDLHEDNLRFEKYEIITKNVIIQFYLTAATKMKNKVGDSPVEGSPQFKPTMVVFHIYPVLLYHIPIRSTATSIF